jgi:cob(I)alamin adenosyltransferase
MKKIYTRTGDDGTTSLFGDERVLKSHPRIDAYGTVDEVNALIGQALAHTDDDTPGAERLRAVLKRLQEELFILGADLATPRDTKPVVPRITEEHTEHLDRDIDAFDNELPPIKNFVLPGGTVAASTLHQARTVCRRAERLTVEAADLVPLDNAALVYLNRLSDLLFVLARWANRQAGVREDVWKADDAESSEEEAT